MITWMGKRLSCFCVVVISLANICSVAAIQPPKKITSRTTMNDNIISLRGGDLGSIDGKTLAKTFSVLAGCDAICGTLVPRTSMKWFGIPIAKGSLSNKYLHGIGSSAATIAVSIFLAASGRSSVEEAIAYGFAARLISMTLMILTDGERKVGMHFSMFGVLWLVLTGTVYSLLTGTGDPLTLTKIVSVVLLIHGLFLYLKPGVFLRKTAIAIGPDPLVEEILSIDGGYMFASAITTGLLAQGVDPVRVSGYTAAGFVPVLYKMFEIVDLEHMWGVNSLFFAMGAAAVMACIVVGTLH